MIDTGWSCKHCKKKFPNERIFMKHDCTQMQRSREIQTTEGRTAYGLYKHWLEKQRRAAPAVETFLTSAYYTSFMKFAVYVKDLGIPDPMKYVEIMVDQKIAPALWRRQEAYQYYLELLDKKVGPYEQATTTVETIIALAEGMEIAPSEVFKSLKVGEVLELIHQRRLSPWLLFCSRTFKEWSSSLHSSERTILMKGLNIDYWAIKMEKAPEVIRNLKEIATELGI